jgi:hypothetical protein
MLIPATRALNKAELEGRVERSRLSSHYELRHHGAVPFLGGGWTGKEMDDMDFMDVMDGM